MDGAAFNLLHFSQTPACRRILNKLTPEKFDKLMVQVKELDINSIDMLKQVVNCVFEKALSEPAFSPVYASFCKALGKDTFKLQDDDGQIIEAHSISAGLDYPGIGPEHAWLNDVGRVDYVSVTDAEALDAFQLCSRLEGIIPALEPSHALAHVLKIAPDLPSDHLLVMNMCGRGDKDVFSVADALDVTL